MNKYPMTEVVTRISPSAYWRLKERLQLAELQGYGPDAASAMAQAAIGLHPPAARKLIVDYTLDGPVYPFMSWPK